MIEVKNLTKEFKETKALDNVSLRFATGKIHGLIGRNGSGKTVLLKILCGFMAPHLGRSAVRWEAGAARCPAGEHGPHHRKPRVHRL